jgi:hypothetical protein
MDWVQSSLGSVRVKHAWKKKKRKFKYREGIFYSLVEERKIEWGFGKRRGNHSSVEDILLELENA